jgi:hypothetical protein
LAKTSLDETSLDETSAANAVPESVRLALGILNRRADQQCLVDGIAQLNGGGGGATQMGHRDGNDARFIINWNLLNKLEFTQTA